MCWLMSKMAVGDFDGCPQHDNSKVVLFCQTCEELVCTRCVSQAPNASPKHRDHVYLDLQDAYDIHKADFEKLVAHFKDHLHQQKQNRQEAQSRLQKLKFEVLRKRTQMEKRSRALKDKLKMAEIDFLGRIEQVAAPAVGQVEEEYTELDYEVVSGDGLLCTAESICKLPVEDSTMFLKNAMKVKRELQDKVENTSNMCKDTSRSKAAMKSSMLHKVSLNLQGEKRAISKAFRIPSRVPSSPRVLQSWCVIGSNRACLTWKYSAVEKVDRFHVYFRPVNDTSIFSTLSLTRIIPKEEETTYTKIPIHNFSSGRTQAILRHLKPKTNYIVKVCACNSVGESPPALVYFMTGDVSPVGNNSKMGQVWLKGRKPVRNCKQVLESLFMGVAGFLAVSVFLVLLLYLILATYEDIMCDRLVQSYGTAEFYKMCPFPVPEPVAHVPEVLKIAAEFTEEESGGWLKWFKWLDIEF